MSALRKPLENPTAPSERPLPRRRVAPQGQRQPKPKNQYQGVAVETGLKVIVNGVLSVAAIATLANLFPYYWSQQSKLQELRTQVRSTEKEVAELQSNFNRSFDPTQAGSVMQEQSGRLAPNQRRVVLTNQNP
ncbi:hypothetical protein VB712_06635 [Spirulina sp. CCNP1310]|uniref:slr1601 family putative cell division protein n=1 Tax=Spirulina sp. CCNP1310 TaxID=3110249 RepID=UPI002B217D4F|nr:hypothetical protein [Spirulina sp. CCNP1310]MEA5418898.1 hypothetical protein [Spirulina sp. CCNP1310]